MKKFVIASVLLLCFVSTSAQEDYESFLSESKVWTMMIKPSVNPEVYGDLRYINETKLVGDTVINGIHFKQKYERQCKQGKEMPTTWSATNEYLGQDGSRIYLYSNWSKNMILDMDLSLQVGDIMTFHDLSDKDIEALFDIIVTAVSDTILAGSTDQKSRRCLYVQLVNFPSLTDIWIEGIGSIQKGISGVYKTLFVGSFDYMTRCTDGDTVLFQSDSSLNILDIRPDGNDVIYDMQGRRLPAPTKGINIIRQNDGTSKKVILK